MSTDTQLEQELKKAHQIINKIRLLKNWLISEDGELIAKYPEEMR
jgi:hypothetical protein